MSTRIYAASDSSNQVKLQHIATIPDLNKAVLTALGAVLVLKGARSAGLVAVGLTVGGAALLSRAIAGKPLSELLGFGGSGGGFSRGTTNTPSFRDGGLPTSQEPEDEVDEAAMESFPASDPPASHRSTQLPPTD